MSSVLESKSPVPSKGKSSILIFESSVMLADHNHACHRKVSVSLNVATSVSLLEGIGTD